MDYDNYFGEMKLKIFPDNASLAQSIGTPKVCKSMIIAVDDKTENRIIINSELSDVDDKVVNELQNLFDNLGENSVATCFCEVDGTFKLWLTAVNIFTNERETALSLYKHGARSIRMTQLEHCVINGETFSNHPFSEEASNMVDEIIFINQGGQEDGWLEFANSNTYITSKSKQVLTTWTERLFVSEMCGVKCQLSA